MTESKRKTSKLFALLVIASAMLAGSITSLYAAAGDIKWTYDAGTRLTHCGLGQDGTVYSYINNARTALAVDRDGNKKWEVSPPGKSFYRQPSIGADGTLFWLSNSGMLALDPDNGAHKWTILAGHFVTSFAMGPEGELYCGTYSGILQVVNPDGTIRWTAEENYVRIWAIALDSYGTIWVSSAAGLFMVHPDGTRKQTPSFPSPGQSSTLSIDEDGTVYFGNDGSILYAFNPDGSEKWTYNTNAGGYDPVVYAPSIGQDGTLYCGCNKTLFALNPDGTLKWRTDVDHYISIPTIGSDGTIFSSGYGWQVISLSALNTVDGSVKWKTALPGVLDLNYFPLLDEDGTLYISGAGNLLYAIETGASAGLADSPWPKMGRDKLNSFASDPFVQTRFLTGEFGPVQNLNHTFSITNRHSSGVSVSVTSDNEFFVAEPPSFSMAPGNTQEVAVSFAPTPENVWQADSGKISVKLTGDNIPANLTPHRYRVNFSAGEISLSKPSLTAPYNTALSCGKDSLLVTNNSLMDVTFNSLVPSALFTIAPDSFTLAAEEDRMVVVTFKPLIPNTESFPSQHTFFFGVTGEYIPEQYKFVHLQSSNTSPFSGGDMLPAPEVFVSSTGNETFTETSGAYELWVKLNEELEAPEVRILISEDGGASFGDTLYCQPKEGNVYAATVAAREMGSSFAYRFEATNSDYAPYIFNLPKRWDRTYAIDVSTVKRGDIDGDWSVNVTDLLGFLQEFKSGSGTDVNRDGKVNIFDLLEILKLMSNR